MSVRVGILAVQGDVLEHTEMLRELGADPVPLRDAEKLNGIDALIIPGGESTTIGKLISYRNIAKVISKFAEEGNPVLGTCAGAILLAKKVRDSMLGDTEQFTLGLMNISVTRNAYGRQSYSFESKLMMKGIGEVRGAFIRAPIIANAWSPAEITGYMDHPSMGRVGVAAQQENLLAISFHPEITGEKKIYEYFIGLAKK
jgi:5'-phosphate synthase pdxT subunit